MIIRTKHYSVILIMIAFLFSGISLFAQSNYSWHEPNYVEGICVRDTNHIYYRLPANMESEVRKPVWYLSKNTAGEFLHFKTTAREITVRYVLEDNLNPFPHMPEMGVSGVDLFAMDMNGNWNWAPPHYHFGDTCVFQYTHLYLADNHKPADFYLYLPLYNTVKWLSIGVPNQDKLEFVRENKGNPIVAYGTSILQGGVASRAGLAWTNILERRLDRTVINLGFSGNGRFEKPIFDLMAKTDAALYILDCMPNLDNEKIYPDSLIKTRVYYGIKTLQEHHPETPILLVEHSVGYSPFYMDTARLNQYHRASMVIAGIYNDLKTDGFKNIYLLTDKEIGFDINSTTEGLHSDDIGMIQYANAYEKIIRQILHEPKGDMATEIPIEQYRDGYDWVKRHDEVMENIKKTNPDAIILGNSIINYWGGEPAAESGIARGDNSWNKYLAPVKVQNAGFGWDRIENVLWRVYHGELDNFRGKKILIMIGTNNLGINSNEDIVNGLQFLLEQIHQKKPDAEIIMAGILPRRGAEKQVETINRQIKNMTLRNHFTYVDFGKPLTKDGKINPALFVSDGLHPDGKGYEVLGKEISHILK
ncbi:MAG: acetylhydrolase [Chitinophagaceae bacterium]|nr:MAG: acetylhydrolase [Chitinophagaceae bacterium]